MKPRKPLKIIVSQVNDPLKIPPDGGWGWIIVLANAICNIVTLPSMTNFGLIYKDKISELAFPATDVSMIININSAFGMSMGLFVGPLLKSFGYRKIAIFAGCLFTVGTIGTAFANSFPHFIGTYSIITAAGYGLATSSFALALNTYFKERRSKAAGITMALSGFGPILYPPLITWLLSVYGLKSCVLVLGGIALNIIFAATLLQPVKYHMKIAQDNMKTFVPNSKLKCKKTETVVIDVPNGNNETESEDEYLESLHLLYVNSETNETLNSSQNPDEQEDKCEKTSMENPSTSILNKQNDPVFSITKIDKICNENQDECRHSISKKEGKISNSISANRLPSSNTKTSNSIIKQWIVNTFDLDLLKDKIFVNIILGMGIATFAEINFSVLTPFILSELNYSTIQIATVMSSLAVADIISRFSAPFFGDFLRLSPRVMYMISLMGLIIGRASVLFVSSYESLLVVGIGLGIAKGVRTVYMILVIPAHVSLEKLPSASGIRMVCNGLMLVILGVIVGRIMDRSGSYAKCIIFINCVTFTCVALWTVEMLYMKCFRKEKLSKNISQNC